MFLNLDEVIAIIREFDHPRDELMVRFSINEVQANAVLDMRLRALRRLEEEAIRTERTSLSEEQSDLRALVGNEERQWRVVHSQIKDVRTHFCKIG